MHFLLNQLQTLVKIIDITYLNIKELDSREKATLICSCRTRS